MTIELDDNVRRALELAVQILGDMPAWLRPPSDMHDMRALLEGEETGRDGMIVVDAIAITLAWPTLEIVKGSKSSDAFINRIGEFTALFELVRSSDPYLFALRYLGMCDRLARRDDNMPAAET